MHVTFVCISSDDFHDMPVGRKEIRNERRKTESDSDDALVVADSFFLSFFLLLTG